MSKWFYRLLFFVLIIAVITLTACSNEAEVLQVRIDALELENAGLKSDLSELRTQLERSQREYSIAQTELQVLILAQEAAQEDNRPDESLAITYGGKPNEDMSWPLSYGDMVVGLRINLDALGEDDEIIWRSANDDIFTVVPSEDGTKATVTPLTIGSAQLIVTVGEQVTRSWVRII